LIQKVLFSFINLREKFWGRDSSKTLQTKKENWFINFVFLIGASSTKQNKNYIAELKHRKFL